MSAEAYAFVWTHGPKSGLRGNDLLLMLFLAGKSRERSLPFMAEASYAEITAGIGMRDKRHVKRMVAKLLQTHHLDPISKGAGGAANIYRFGRKGVVAGEPTRRVAEEPPLYGVPSEAA